MKPRDQDNDALDRLIAEARAETPPSVSWDEVEAALMARAAKTSSAPARARGGIYVVLAAAAFLAAGGIILLRGAPTVVPGVTTTGPVAEQATPRAPHHIDGDALAVGAEVASGADALVVEHKGHATWTLSPESTAHVESVGDIVALALDRGAMTAQVVKSPKPESFVVRVERTRIAVHGTRFTVTRLANSVRVEVEEGVVGVSPVGKRGFELRAPDGATVDFDGMRTDVAASASESKRAAPAAPAGAGNQLQKKSFENVELDDEGIPRGAQPSIDSAIAGIQGCLKDNTVSVGDLRVSVRTTMTLRVDAKGAAAEALFAPPLAPNVGACVDAALEKVTFPRSTGGFVVNRALELNR